MATTPAPRRRYRPGGSWGLTVVAVDPASDGTGRAPGDELVAVVVNGDRDLARRICDGLNAAPQDHPG